MTSLLQIHYSSNNIIILNKGGYDGFQGYFKRKVIPK